MNVNHIHASSILYRIKRDLNHLIIRLDNLPQTPARKALMDAIARACVEAINTTASDLIASTDTEGGN